MVDGCMVTNSCTEILEADRLAEGKKWYRSLWKRRGEESNPEPEELLNSQSLASLHR